MKDLNEILSIACDMVSSNSYGYLTIQTTQEGLFVAVHNRENLEESNEIISLNAGDRNLVYSPPYQQHIPGTRRDRRG